MSFSVSQNLWSRTTECSPIKGLNECQEPSTWLHPINSVKIGHTIWHLLLLPVWHYIHSTTRSSGWMLQIGTNYPHVERYGNSWIQIRWSSVSLRWLSPSTEEMLTTRDPASFLSELHWLDGDIDRPRPTDTFPAESKESNALWRCRRRRCPFSRGFSSNLQSTKCKEHIWEQNLKWSLKASS